MPNSRRFKQPRLMFICLALSILAWFAVKISKNYTQTYQFTVEFINLPKDKFLTYRSDIMITVIMESKGVSLLRFEFSKKRIIIDYSLITTKKQQQNNHITIENNQLYSYFINQLNFPINSRIVNPTPISLDFEELPDN